MKQFFSLRTIASLLALFTASAALIAGIKSSVSAVEAASFLPVAAIGVLFSYVLGLTKMKTNRAVAWLALAGFLMIYLEAGRLREPLTAILRSLPRIELDLLRSIVNEDVRVDASFVQSQWELVAARSHAFFSRILNGNFKSLTVRETVWNLPISFLAAWSAWWTSRRRLTLNALAPSLTLHGFILYYTNTDPLSLQVAVFALVFLMGLHQQWNIQPEHSAIIEKTRRETYSAVMVLALVLAIGSGFMPSLSIKKAAQEFTETNSLARSLGLNREIAKTYVISGLPRQHLVGLDPSVSQSIVFIAKTGELPTTDKDIITQPVPRHYWRWLIYDVYNGQGWSTSPVTSVSHTANEALFRYQGIQYRSIHQQVEKAFPQDDRLYWTGTLVRANQPFESTWRIAPESLPSGVDPLLAADMLGSLTQKQIYSADSFVPILSEVQLRTSNSNYPVWIREKYLTLPASVTERTVHLAEDLTLHIENPYDKAKAIEAYLRTYEYSLQVQPPPPNQDVADYFLFDLRKGYCDYYATSMVVLARAAGLPARLVIGYASGEYDPIEAAYIVREQDAHSWVEIYFTGIGWVEFEPTAGRPLNSLPVEIQEEDPVIVPFTPTEPHLSSAYTKRGFLPPSPLLPIGIGIVSVLLLAGGWYLHREGLLRQHNSIGSIYGYLQMQGGRVYKHARPSDTPFRFAQHLKSRLQTGSRWMQSAHEEIDQLTQYYVQETYSAHPVTVDERKHAAQIWRRLFWKLLAARAFLYPAQIIYKLLRNSITNGLSCSGWHW